MTRRLVYWMAVMRPSLRLHPGAEIHPAGGAGSRLLAEWPGLQRAPATGHAPFTADVQWRQFFTDPRLQKIIDTSLDNNRDLRVAALNVERARAMYRIQRAELLPRLETGVTASKQRVTISGHTGLATLQQFSVNLGSPPGSWISSGASAA